MIQACCFGARHFVQFSTAPRTARPGFRVQGSFTGESQLLNLKDLKIKDKYEVITFLCDLFASEQTIYCTVLKKGSKLGYYSPTFL